MSQQDEYQRLARQFVDAWQENMASMMNDGDFIRALMQMMQTSAFSAKDSGTYANPFFTQPTGGTTTASGAGDNALARLEQRLGAIEERIAHIENAAAAFPKSKKLGALWQNVLSDPALAQAAQAEAAKRAAEFLKGVYKYKQTAFIRDAEEPVVAFTLGAARLLDYGCEDAYAPVVLLVPSLINRYYILDLSHKLSFAHYLQAQGLRVLVVDWGVPSECERYFNCGLYVTETLVPMMEWVQANISGPTILGGYCMGGLMALALAQIRPDLVDGLALFATPWDFSVPGFPRIAMMENELAAFSQYLHSLDALPAETIHTLFHAANPYAFQDKLREFAGMDINHPTTQEFLAIEHWVNDGVPMTRGVAQDCLIDWAQRNTPARNQWRVGGQVIDPKRLNIPCFIAAPQEDKIVPSDCALPLAKLIKHCTLIQPRSGHVGMMVGSRRKMALWEPFSNWVAGQFS